MDSKYVLQKYNKKVYKRKFFCKKVHFYSRKSYVIVSVLG